VGKHDVSEVSREESKAIGLVVDSDTGALLRYEPLAQGWVASVAGARAVEFLFPTNESESYLSRDGKPTYTQLRSHVSLAGAKVALSGPFWGRVLQSSQAVLRKPQDSLDAPPSAGKCFQEISSEIWGSFDSDGERNSEIRYEARDPQTGEYKPLSQVEYAYLVGDVRTRLPERGQGGCGLWMTNAFDVDYGRPEARLNVQRYALGARRTDVSVALPPGMIARRSISGVVTFEVQTRRQSQDRPDDKRTLVETGSSVWVYDLRKGQRLGVSAYVYSDLGAKAPLQVGTWEDGRVSLVEPGASFEWESGRAKRAETRQR
jgi:hypothetical protein